MCEREIDEDETNLHNILKIHGWMVKVMVCVCDMFSIFALLCTLLLLLLLLLMGVEKNMKGEIDSYSVNARTHTEWTEASWEN